MPRDDVWKYLCFSVVEPLLLLIYLVLVSVALPVRRIYKLSSESNLFCSSFGPFSPLLVNFRYMIKMLATIVVKSLILLPLRGHKLYDILRQPEKNPRHVRDFTHIWNLRAAYIPCIRAVFRNYIWRIVNTAKTLENPEINQIRYGKSGENLWIVEKKNIFELALRTVKIIYVYIINITDLKLINKFNFKLQKKRRKFLILINDIVFVDINIKLFYFKPQTLK